MPVLIKTTSVFHGIECDVTSCSATIRPAQPIRLQWLAVPPEAFEVQAKRDGWSMRSARSNRWYCPAHEANAYACISKRYCTPERPMRMCVAHGRGGHVSGREFRELIDPTKDAQHADH